MAPVHSKRDGVRRNRGVVFFGHWGSKARTLLIYPGAAAVEIAGCFALWAWTRSGKSAWWLVPGVALLVLFAYLLAPVPVAAVGRASAANGGVYIAASLPRHWAVEGIRLDRWISIGALISLDGAAAIVAAPR